MQCKVQLTLVCIFVCQISPSFFGRSSQQNQASGGKPYNKAPSEVPKNTSNAVFFLLFHIFLLQNSADDYEISFFV
jgi:hypothetical protein